jgi:chemotaxis protein MotA
MFFREDARDVFAGHLSKLHGGIGLIDITTIVGVLFLITVQVTGIVISAGASGFAGLAWYYDLSSLFITYGGCTAATMIQFPLSDLKKIMKVTWNAFRSKPIAPQKLIKDFIRYAEIARRDGILALEGVTEEIKDEFLVKGLQLAVDGTDPELIQTMMVTELEQLQERHAKGKQLYDALAMYAPAFGMVGTLLGSFKCCGISTTPR